MYVDTKQKQKYSVNGPIVLHSWPKHVSRLISHHLFTIYNLSSCSSLRFGWHQDESKSRAGKALKMHKINKMSANTLE